ncbi:hypothetical protein C2S51_022586 [Perilla frutescens var. frutescens]|nr:hypothetical protein C2S51_022586 [Perilla frutescens var. frutescens]
MEEEFHFEDEEALEEEIKEGEEGLEATDVYAKYVNILVIRWTNVTFDSTPISCQMLDRDNNKLK